MSNRFIQIQKSEQNSKGRIRARKFFFFEGVIGHGQVKRERGFGESSVTEQGLLGK